MEKKTKKKYVIYWINVVLRLMLIMLWAAAALGVILLVYNLGYADAYHQSFKHCFDLLNVTSVNP